MTESILTIKWVQNSDGSTDLAFEGITEYLTHFREAFLTVDKPYAVNYVTERETSGQSASKSATIALLSYIIKIIRNCNETNGI